MVTLSIPEFCRSVGRVSGPTHPKDRPICRPALGVIKSLNAATPLPDSQTDTDRDGDPAPTGILRLFDLLNGAGESH